jgi:hypothetical protein
MSSNKLANAIYVKKAAQLNLTKASISSNPIYKRVAGVLGIGGIGAASGYFGAGEYAKSLGRQQVAGLNAQHSRLSTLIEDAKRNLGLRLNSNKELSSRIAGEEAKLQRVTNSINKVDPDLTNLPKEIQSADETYNNLSEKVPLLKKELEETWEPVEQIIKISPNPSDPLTTLTAFPTFGAVKAMDAEAPPEATKFIRGWLRKGHPYFPNKPVGSNPYDYKNRYPFLFGLAEDQATYNKLVDLDRKVIASRVDDLEFLRTEDALKAEIDDVRSIDSLSHELKYLRKEFPGVAKVYDKFKDSQFFNAKAKVLRNAKKILSENSSGFKDYKAAREAVIEGNPGKMIGDNTALDIVHAVRASTGELSQLSYSVDNPLLNIFDPRKVADPLGDYNIGSPLDQIFFDIYNSGK